MSTEIRLIEWRIKYPEQLRQHTDKQALSPLFLADKTTLINIMQKHIKMVVIILTFASNK
nr:MAG TPA: hypothetical protein [Caudoviricetes sp.]